MIPWVAKEETYFAFIVIWGVVLSKTAASFALWAYRLQEITEWPFALLSLAFCFEEQWSCFKPVTETQCFGGKVQPWEVPWSGADSYAIRIMTILDDPRIFVLIFLLTFFMYVSGILYIEHLEALVQVSHSVHDAYLPSKASKVPNTTLMFSPWPHWISGEFQRKKTPVTTQNDLVLW